MHKIFRQCVPIFALICAIQLSPTKIFAEGLYSDKVQCSELSKETIQKLLEQHQQLGVNSKALAATQLFMGRASGWTAPSPSTSDIKEEALAVDIEKLNCMSYVDHVLAISQSKNWEDYLTQLRHGRYFNGLVSLVTRLHFPEGDWRPYQIDRVILSDITQNISQSLSKQSYKEASATILRKDWMNALFPGQANYDDYPMPSVIKAQIPYIDFDEIWTHPTKSDEEQNEFASKETALFDAMKAATGDEQKRLQTELSNFRLSYRLKDASLQTSWISNLPPLTIFLLVRPTHQVAVQGKKVTDMLVSHMGFLVKKDGQLFVRHAPSKAGSVVIDIPFDQYFSNFLVTGSNLDDSKNRRSTWRGLNFLKLNEIP